MTLFLPFVKKNRSLSLSAVETAPCCRVCVAVCVFCLTTQRQTAVLSRAVLDPPGKRPDCCYVCGFSGTALLVCQSVFDDVLVAFSVRRREIHPPRFAAKAGAFFYFNLFFAGSVGCRSALGARQTPSLFATSHF